MDDIDATAATRQAPAATKKDATASGADAAACAAAATHPVCLYCAELPPIPLLSLLPSSLLSSLLPLLAQTSHAVLYSARWGSCCRAPSFYLSNVPLLPAALSLSPGFSSARRLFFTAAVVASCISEVQKMMLPKPWNASNYFLLTSLFSLSMAFPWHLPPRNKWRENSRERDGSL